MTNQARRRSWAPTMIGPVYRAAAGMHPFSCCTEQVAWLHVRQTDPRRYRVWGRMLVGGMPGHRASSPVRAPFPPLNVVYAREQHQDRADPDDDKRKYQSNRCLTAHTAILSPRGINAVGFYPGPAPGTSFTGATNAASGPPAWKGRRLLRNRGSDEFLEPPHVCS